MPDMPKKIPILQHTKEDLFCGNKQRAGCKNAKLGNCIWGEEPPLSARKEKTQPFRLDIFINSMRYRTVSALCSIL